MANRNWRSGGYQNFNQILTPMSYYPQPMSYPADRKNYGGRGGYREDNSKRERKDFQSNRHDHTSPIQRKSPYSRPHEINGNFRNEPKKSYGHYEVKVPHLTYDLKELSTPSIKFRYPKMYVPSDFFHSQLNVLEAFPLYRPMKLGNHCEFQMINKDMDISELIESVTEPSDADCKYSAKVMLITTPNISELYKLTCHMPLDYAIKSQPRYGLYKNIQFLVGSKNRAEPFAIGGAWSASLDGPNPEEDPEVLVKTAIRTCKAMTGIDLSHCKKWYKFLDIQYYRSSGHKTEQTNEIENNDAVADVESEPIVEIVTIFIPDIWSCTPSQEEWEDVKEKYDKKLQSLLFPKAVEEELVESKNEDYVEIVEKSEEKVEEVKEMVEEIKESVATPILDLNQMKVTELRAELTERGLDSKGLKSQLIQRLQEAIDNEKSIVENKVVGETKVSENVVENHAIHVVETVKEKEPNPIFTSPLSEKEQKRLRWLYKINERPSIMVYPMKNAKGEHNEFSLMSLEKLLDYRVDDTKETCFEVSLFAEQFREMIQRDAAFVIYKALLDLPEVKETDTEPEAKKARVDSEVGVRRSKLIVDVDLLFAFFVFDNENCGYLRDHDLENILHCIGLNLSRSQAKRLLSRLPIKKGNVLYRDAVERDVIEGSHEDVACLKTCDVNVERLIELSQGNKGFFDEVDSHSLGSRDGSLSLLDRLTSSEVKVSRYQMQLTMLQDELLKLKSVEDSAADVATHLRDNIAKIADKLALEKASMDKLSSEAAVYRGLLKRAQDHMYQSMTEINGQFEKERLAAEKVREEAEAARAAVAEAARAAAAEAERVRLAAAAKEEADKAAEVDTEPSMEVTEAPLAT